MSYRIKNYIPRESEALVGPEYTFKLIVHAIRADVDGVMYARLCGDPIDAWRKYTIAAGDYAYGEFAACRPGSFADDELLGLSFSVA